jgi:tryptophan halogenase
MEPLESTSIHLIQTSLARLLSHFPDKRFNRSDIDAFNRRTVAEYEKVRDFLVLHYTATRRDDTEFWRHCQTIEQPDSLKGRIEQFRDCGRIFAESSDIFGTASWLAVLYGQGIKPAATTPLIAKVPLDRIDSIIGQIGATIDNAANGMPSHQEFIDENCSSISVI